MTLFKSKWLDGFAALSKAHHMMHVELCKIFIYSEEHKAVCMYCQNARFPEKVWEGVWKLDFLKALLLNQPHKGSIQRLRNKHCSL